MNRTSWLVILVLAVIAVAGWWLYLDLRKRPVDVVTKVETRVDTIRVEKPVPVFTKLVSYKFFDFPVESVVYRDSLVEVPIPIEKKIYQDSTYYVEVSGFHPNLEHIEIYNRSTTITQTHVVKQRPIVSFGIGASAIWNPVTHQFDWGIGGSVIIPLWSWYH